MQRYSLTDYILSVKVPESLRDVFLGDNDTNDSTSNVISIGGDGSYIGSITIQRQTAQWNTQADATGSWVHSQSKDKHGTIQVRLNQVSDKVRLLIRLYETYYSSDITTEGLTITVNKAVGGGNQKEVCNCVDCYIVNIPEQQYGSSTGEQNWQFTCGQINFTGDAN